MEVCIRTNWLECQGCDGRLVTSARDASLHLPHFRYHLLDCCAVEQGERPLKTAARTEVGIMDCRILFVGDLNLSQGPASALRFNYYFQIGERPPSRLLLRFPSLVVPLWAVSALALGTCVMSFDVATPMTPRATRRRVTPTNYQLASLYYVLS